MHVLLQLVEKKGECGAKILCDSIIASTSVRKPIINQTLHIHIQYVFVVDTDVNSLPLLLIIL